MLLPRLCPPLGASIRASNRPACTLEGSLISSFALLSLTKPTPSHLVRHASHKAQGAVNGSKNGPGKHLGAKKTGNSYVIPGNIIFRQRGTHWFPGDNCSMGRDHTIHATETGYVRYYKDPLRHPKRQYIGVVFERDQTLPMPANKIRRRRFGMSAVPMSSPPQQVETAEDLVMEGDPESGMSINQKPKKERRGEEGRKLVLKDGYMYREANWQIGMAAERAKVRVREYKPRDRWTAWKKATKRKALNAEKRRLGRRKR